MGQNIDQLYIPPSSGGGGGGGTDFASITGDPYDNIALGADLDGKVDTTTTVNGEPLSSNVTLVTDDIAEDGAPINLWFTDERAQDAVGAMVDDSQTVQLAYDGATPSLIASLVFQDSQTINLSEDASGLKADVVYQDTNTVELSEDASGLKADVLFSATSDNVASNDTGIYVKRQSTQTTVAPTVDDDSSDGILIGHIWLDGVLGQTYVCLGNNVGGAKWKQIAGMYREMDIPANAMTPATGITGAVAATIEYGNGLNVEVLEFEATDDTYAIFSMRFPNVTTDTNLKFEIHWIAKDSGSGDVVWGIQAASLGNGDAMNLTWGTASTVTDTYLGQNLKQVITLVPSPSIQPPSAGSVIYFRFYRDADAGGDTYAGVAQLERIVVQYREDAYVNSEIFS